MCNKCGKQNRFFNTPGHCLNFDSVQFVPDKLQHQGYSGPERPCYSELHTLLRGHSASAALLDCRKHAPLWCSSVWPDFLFLWNTKQIKKYLWEVNYPLFATNRNEFSTLSTAWVNPFDSNFYLSFNVYFVILYTLVAFATFHIGYLRWLHGFCQAKGIPVN